MEFGKYFEPMLLSEIENPFDSKEYLFELKFDGIRATIHVGKDTFIIYSRNGKDITNLYPELKEIKKQIKEDMIFDGEIVIFNNKKSDFSKLQERNNLRNTLKIKRLSKEMPVCFIAFDCLYKSKDLTSQSLLERKEVLNMIDYSDYFVKTKSVLNDGKLLFKKIKQLGLEGIVAKKIDSKYEINNRTKDWIKIKNYKIENFYIGGYYDNPKHSMITLYLGEYRENEFYYVGKVMMGKKRLLYNKIIRENIEDKTVFNDYKDNKIKYLKPKITCKIAYQERTKNNHLRHPVFKTEIKKNI